MQKMKEAKNQGSFVIRYKYSKERNRFECLTQEKGANVDNEGNGICSNNMKNIPMQACHRCRILQREDGMRQCRSKFCGGGHDDEKMQYNGKGGDGDGGRKWWCQCCTKLLRKHYAFISQKKGEWCGPCCMGTCDCLECRHSKTADDDKAESNPVDFVKSCKNFIGLSIDDGGRMEVEDKVICMTCLRNCCKSGMRCHQMRLSISALI